MVGVGGNGGEPALRSFLVSLPRILVLDHEAEREVEDAWNVPVRFLLPSGVRVRDHTSRHLRQGPLRKITVQRGLASRRCRILVGSDQPLHRVWIPPGDQASGEREARDERRSRMIRSWIHPFLPIKTHEKDRLIQLSSPVGDDKPVDTRQVTDGTYSFKCKFSIFKQHGP